MIASLLRNMALITQSKSQKQKWATIKKWFKEGKPKIHTLQMVKTLI